nr:MAG TPA: hypothetical protein [Bacteriophage sp.]
MLLIPLIKTPFIIKLLQTPYSKIVAFRFPTYYNLKFEVCVYCLTQL